jgi:hypothetical protein
MIDAKELLKNKDKFMDILKVDSAFAELINNPPIVDDEEYDRLMNPPVPNYKEMLFELSKKYRSTRETLSLIKQIMNWNISDEGKVKFVNQALEYGKRK